MNPWIKYILLIPALILGMGLSQAQNKRQELEKKKASLKKDIEFKNKLLKETARNKKKSLNQLVILKKKISEREELITTIQSEIGLLEEEIEENTSTIAIMQEDIKAVKEEYAELVRFAYQNRSNADKIMYVFAAKDFNQAYKRLKYIREYADYRKRQAETIQRLEAELRTENDTLIARKEQKVNLLSSLDSERSMLAEERSEQNKVYSELQDKEKELKAEIRKTEKEQRALQNAIERIIAEEIRKAREASGSSSTGWSMTPEAKALSANFTGNKAKLPWPVEKGVITQRYGVRAHPVLTHLKIRNNGVTISTEKGAQARAVFEGEVSKVIVIPGAGKAVIIRHGEYLTVYGNLADVYVSAGDQVTTKQALGTVITDADKTEVQFEIRRGQNAETLDPSYWLYNAR